MYRYVFVYMKILSWLSEAPWVPLTERFWRVFYLIQYLK